MQKVQFLWHLEKQMRLQALCKNDSLVSGVTSCYHPLFYSTPTSFWRNTRRNMLQFYPVTRCAYTVNVVLKILCWIWCRSSVNVTPVWDTKYSNCHDLCNRSVKWSIPPQYLEQWRMNDLPEGTPTPKATSTINIHFTQICIKWRIFGWADASLDPPGGAV